MVIFESIAKPLLFLHLLAGIAVVATAIHLLCRFVIKARGRRGLLRLVRLHALLLLIFYTCTVVLGALLYPTFRVRVRHEYFDEHVPFATSLFEIKEHLAALGLLPVVLLYVIAHQLQFRDQHDRRYIWLFLGTLGFLTAIVSFNAWCGWWLGTLRSV